jgi:hypothetical protein
LQGFALFSGDVDACIDSRAGRGRALARVQEAATAKMTRLIVLPSLLGGLSPQSRNVALTPFIRA